MCSLSGRRRPVRPKHALSAMVRGRSVAPPLDYQTEKCGGLVSMATNDAGGRADAGVSAAHVVLERAKNDDGVDAVPGR